MICVGQISEAHGLLGWLKVYTYTQDPKSICNYGPLLCDETLSLNCTFRKHLKDSFVLISCSEVTDRTQAEALVGKKLYVYKDKLPSLKEDEFYFNDLIGVEVYNELEALEGIVKGVFNYGAGDFVEIEDMNGKVATLPFNKDSILEVNLEKRTLKAQSAFILS